MYIYLCIYIYIYIKYIYIYQNIFKYVYRTCQPSRIDFAQCPAVRSILRMSSIFANPLKFSRIIPYCFF